MPPQRTRYHSPGRTTRATSCLAFRRDRLVVASPASSARQRALWASCTSLPTATARRAHVFGAGARDESLVAVVRRFVASASPRPRRPRPRLRPRSRRPPSSLSSASPSIASASSSASGPLVSFIFSSRLATRLVVHALEARERQRGLIADGEEDHRIAWRARSSARSRAGLRRGCRCTRSRGPRSRPGTAPTCWRGPDGCAPCVRVSSSSIRWTSLSGSSRSCSKQAVSKTASARDEPVCRRRVAGREQLAAVLGHGKIGMVRARRRPAGTARAPAARRSTTVSAASRHARRPSPAPREAP